MDRRIVILVAGAVIAGVAGLWLNVFFMNRSLVDLSEGGEATRRAQVAAQNETAFVQPAMRPRPTPQANANKNLYFGDLHVHTDLSFDAYLFGNRLSPEDAYRFASGEAVKNAAGETMRIGRPLDFVALTDHAESFGLFETCARSDLVPAVRAYCDKFDRPSLSFFMALRREGEARPPQRPQGLCENEADCLGPAKTTWSKIVAAADAHYQPGEFTTFAAYEYSPPLPDRGKLHRNVIFRSNDVPELAVSAFEAPTVIDLWRRLERECSGSCRALTIPHNMNKTWGLAYDDVTIDGDPYSREDWSLRRLSEPLAEITQIKGASECAVGVGATDEECGFEQYFPPCTGGKETSCIHPTSMARDGLKIGLAKEMDLGFNPLQFGFIGSTDTHNSNPGDTEEWDYRGSTGLFTSPAQRRHKGLVKKRPQQMQRNPGGLAAVWAEENTRSAIFDALKAREAYATSGTRIALRFFAGWRYGEDVLASTDIVDRGYRGGVPMGSVVNGRQERPQFLIWAVQDPDSAPLQKVQMVKGWFDGEVVQETVIDIACSGGAEPDPATKRCPQTDADVDLADCSLTGDAGARELKALWTDPDYDPSHSAFYYVRVLQNPTCRYSTYDALRLGKRLPKKVPATVQERAWSSPIWIRRR